MNKMETSELNSKDSIEEGKNEIDKKDMNDEEIKEEKSKDESLNDNDKSNDDNDNYHDIITIKDDEMKNELFNKLKEESETRVKLESKINNLEMTIEKQKEENKQQRDEIINLKDIIKSKELVINKLINSKKDNGEKISQLENTIEQLQQNIILLSNQGKINAIKSNLNKTRLESREKQINKLNSELDNYEEDIVNLKATVLERNNQLEKTAQTKTAYQMQNHNLLEDMRVLSRENEGLREQNYYQDQNVQSLQTQNEEMEYNFENLNHKYNTVIKENEHLCKNLQIFIDENKAAAHYIRVLKAKIDDLTNIHQRLINENNNLVDQINKRDEDNKIITNEYNNIKNDLNSIVIQYNNIQKDLNEAKEYNSRYKACINSLNNQILELNTQITFLEVKAKEIEKSNQYKKEENYFNITKEYEKKIQFERERNIDAEVVINSLRSQMRILRNENDRLSKEIMASRINNNGNNIQTSDEDNVYLREFINRLQKENEDLRNELSNVKNENIQLYSEREHYNN